MGRMIFMALVLLLVLAGVGFLALGAFPPEPQPVPVHKVLPNDQFTPKAPGFG